MKIAYIAPDDWQEEIIPALEKLGYAVVKEVDEDCDLIYGNSITQMPRIWEAHKKYPNIPLINYVWDLYSWALERKREDEYDYDSYKELCQESKEIWVPSKAVQKSLEDYWNMESIVLKSFIPTIPYPDTKPQGYAFQALRMNPDANMDWFERGCKETGMPYKMTDPNEPLPEEKYRPLLAHSSFLVSPIYEMSTGGLFLMEGAIFEKPILASNSPYMGAIEYFGDTIAYFQWDDFEDFKDKLLGMWTGKIQTDVERAKKKVEEMTPENMAREIDERLKSW